MKCRICIDPPAARAVATVEKRCAELEDLFLDPIEIRYSQIEVELLRASRVRPSRRLIVSHPLESEDEPGPGVEGRPALAQRPSRIRPVDRSAENRPVEAGKLGDVRAVKHHTLKAGDHEGSLGWRGLWPSLGCMAGARPYGRSSAFGVLRCRRICRSGLDILVRRLAGCRLASGSCQALGLSR